MDPKSLIDSAAVLKNMPRTGWLQRGVPSSEAETIAEHTYEVVSIIAAICMTYGKGLDMKRMLLMGIIHDWGEAVTGDIPRGLTSRIGKDVKSRVDTDVIMELAAKSGIKSLNSLFEEYEKRETLESILVKFADLLSTLRQSIAYKSRGFNVEDIANSCSAELNALMEKIENDELKELVKKII